MPSYETEKYEFYPADKYHLIVDSIEEVESNYGGRVTEQLRVKFFIKGGDYDDKPVSFWCGRGKGVAYISLWGAFGIDAVGRTLNTDKLYGK